MAKPCEGCAGLSAGMRMAQCCVTGNVCLKSIGPCFVKPATNQNVDRSAFHAEKVDLSIFSPEKCGQVHFLKKAATP